MLRIGLAVAACLLAASLFCVAGPAYALDDLVDTQADAVANGLPSDDLAALADAQDEAAKSAPSADSQEQSAVQASESSSTVQEGSASAAGESAVLSADAVETPVASADEIAGQNADESSSQLAPASDTASQGDAAEPGLVVASDGETPSYEESHVNMYRLYNPNSGEHFYTSSESEAISIAGLGWQWEGIGWVAPSTSDVPVYRLYNPNGGDHFFTTSATERDGLVKKGWKYEGIGWYSDAEGTGLVVYRQYNKNAKTGSHNYTTSATENASLVKMGWTAEGIAWYATNGANLPFTARWLVSPAWTGSLERYWLDSNASVAKSRLVTASEGAGYTAYARSNGIIVRGKWDNGAGRVYVANNDGKLASTSDGNTGWLVTKAYDGVLQRYRYDATSHAMLSGFFVVDGARYFGMGNNGYVLRGKTNWGNHVLLANNDGVMPSATGWLVTGIYDGGNLQRYWLQKAYQSFVGARTGFFNAEGSKYFGVYNEGYVLRNDFIKDGSTWYKADNDGKLVKSVPPAQYLMTEYAQRFSSATRWLIMINLDTAMLGVYTGSQGNWTCVQYWLCSPGKPSTPTVTGTFTTLDRKPHLSTAYSARYCTRFYGGYFIHSILGTGNELGSYRYLSHGCVRVEVDNARWIYENVPLGTTVHVYN